MFKINLNNVAQKRTFIEKVLRKFYLPEPKFFKISIFSPWERYERRIKKNHPIRWFFWETIPDWWDRFVTHPIRIIKDFFRYRYKEKYHLVDTGLKPGYYDIDDRILHACFNLFVDYIEIELAALNRSVVADLETRKTGTSITSFYENLRWFRKQNLREPEQGLALLDREINRKPHHGSRCELFMEKKFLYLWWKEYRPRRIDAYTDPLIWGLNLNDQNYDIHKRRYEIVDNLEKFYSEEDGEMLKRLMDIRPTLWV